MAKIRQADNHQVERRINWKSAVSKAAERRARVRQRLLLEKEKLSSLIRECGTDFVQYDKLKERQREVIAKLAKI